MLTAASHWLPISVASLPVKFSTGPWWEKKSGAIPVAASPFFPPFSCLSKVGLAGQIAARFTLLAAYYGAATLPARPPASLIGVPPQAKLYEPYRYHPSCLHLRLVCLRPSSFHVRVHIPILLFPALPHQPHPARL